MASERVTLIVEGPEGAREVSLSSPGRVIWPEQGITKRELAEYFITVAAPFLAHNGARPVSLERFADSIEGDSFFSKNPPKGTPPYVEQVEVTCRHVQWLRDKLPAFEGQPDRYVVWGKGTTDEMCLGMLQVAFDGEKA